MNPIRVVGPTESAVTLDEMKDHLRINHSDQDALIQSLVDAAEAHLDGWRGVLGRCIMPQTWRLSMKEGAYYLPFPDITAVTGGEWDGYAVTLTEDGPVDFTCALPADAMPAIRDAIKVWVQMRYDGLSGPERDAYQATFNALVQPLRWGF